MVKTLNRNSLIASSTAHCHPDEKSRVVDISVQPSQPCGRILVNSYKNFESGKQANTRANPDNETYTPMKT
jgi:hypothetical protein